MLLKTILSRALLIGFIAGGVMTIAQHFGVLPIIFAAEAFEVEAPADEHGGHHHHGHHHDHDAWAPEDGLERSSFTFASNVLAGVGFAAVLLALMSLVQIKGWTQLSLGKGVLWGIAGFIVFFAAPGVGLPPEIPGIEAVAVESRQLWWLLTVIATGIGLAVFAFAPSWFKLIGLAVILVPFLVGAPHPQGPAFINDDPNVVAQLTQLHQDFIVASGIANLIFWLSLGALSGWLLNRRNGAYA